MGNINNLQQELSYRKQIARQLRTQYVEGICANPVTLKCRLRATKGQFNLGLGLLMDVSLSGFRSIAESVRAVLLLPIRFWSQWTGS